MEELKQIHPQAIAQMMALGGKWAVYENVALDSAGLGHMQFLKIGEDCTYKEPPPQYPADTEHGMGWRYRYVGMVDFESGIVRP